MSSLPLLPQPTGCGDAPLLRCAPGPCCAWPRLASRCGRPWAHAPAGWAEEEALCVWLGPTRLERSGRPKCTALGMYSRSVRAGGDPGGLPPLALPCRRIHRCSGRRCSLRRCALSAHITVRCNLASPRPSPATRLRAHGDSEETQQTSLTALMYKTFLTRGSESPAPASVSRPSDCRARSLKSDAQHRVVQVLKHHRRPRC